MRVMAIGAHPDDLEILCAGTLARYVAEGHAVTMCHEARRAAERIGAEYLALGIPDGEISASDPRQREIVTEAIRVARPDVVLAHAANDYMTDHVEASRLALDCSFLATLPLFETESPHLVSVPALAYMETVSGNDFVPTEFVDISGFVETKLEMLSKHESQLTWLADHDGVDMLDQVRTVSRYRGLQCGVEHAEGFIPCNIWLRARTTRFLP